MSAAVERLLLAAVLAVAVVTACDDQGANYLDGSMTDRYGLGFDSVRIRLYPSELSIEYVADTSQGEKVALRIALDAAASPFATGVFYDLATQGSITQGEGYGSPLPDLESGELKFSAVSIQDGDRVKGKFDARFLTENSTTLTLRGGFSAKLEVIAP
jgi:hypothetical protein